MNLAANYRSLHDITKSLEFYHKTFAIIYKIYGENNFPQKIQILS